MWCNIQSRYNSIYYNKKHPRDSNISHSNQSSNFLLTHPNHSNPTSKQPNPSNYPQHPPNRPAAHKAASRGRIRPRLHISDCLHHSIADSSSLRFKSSQQRNQTPSTWPPRNRSSRSSSTHSSRSPSSIIIAYVLSSPVQPSPVPVPIFPCSTLPFILNIR